MSPNTETVVRIERVLTLGSSFPSLVETASGEPWVMKLSGTGPGKRALATEYIALDDWRGSSASTCPTPRSSICRAGLPWDVGTDEFYEAVQRSAGLNLGIAFIADAVDLKAADLPSLPAAFLDRLGAVDALLQNVDRTTANPNIIRDRARRALGDRFRCVPADRSAGTRRDPAAARPATQSLSGRREERADFGQSTGDGGGDR